LLENGGCGGKGWGGGVVKSCPCGGGGGEGEGDGGAKWTQC
jgi:hypothetical protein